MTPGALLFEGPRRELRQVVTLHHTYRGVAAHPVPGEIHPCRHEIIEFDRPVAPPTACVRHQTLPSAAHLRRLQIRRSAPGPCRPGAPVITSLTNSGQQQLLRRTPCASGTLKGVIGCAAASTTPQNRSRERKNPRAFTSGGLLEDHTCTTTTMCGAAHNPSRKPPATVFSVSRSRVCSPALRHRAPPTAPLPRCRSPLLLAAA